MDTGRVLDVDKKQTKQGKDIYYVNIESGGKTVKYQCWDSAISDKAGKEVSFTVKPAPDGTTFAPTLVLPKEGGFTGRPGFAPRGASPEQLDTMILSYKKDLMIKCADIALAISGRSDAFMDDKEICKIALACYKTLGTPLFAHKEDHDPAKS